MEKWFPGSREGQGRTVSWEPWALAGGQEGLAAHSAGRPRGYRRCGGRRGWPWPWLLFSRREGRPGVCVCGGGSRRGLRSEEGASGVRTQTVGATAHDVRPFTEEEQDTRTAEGGKPPYVGRGKLRFSPLNPARGWEHSRGKAAGPHRSNPPAALPRFLLLRPAPLVGRMTLVLFSVGTAPSTRLCPNCLSSPSSLSSYSRGLCIPINYGRRGYIKNGSRRQESPTSPYL